eukprot:5384358-Prymnesium_polylepis.1
MRLDRQASLGGFDHHVEKESALPAGSGSSYHARSACSPEQTAVPGCRPFIHGSRLGVKERRTPPTVGKKSRPAQKATQGLYMVSGALSHAGNKE